MVFKIMYYVYILRCMDNSLYTGITTDLERRMKEHFEKTDKCAKYTRYHCAYKLEIAWQTDTKALASKLEYHIKKDLSKFQKEKLLENPENMEIFLGEKIDCEKFKVDKGTVLLSIFPEKYD